MSYLGVYEVFSQTLSLLKSLMNYLHISRDVVVSLKRQIQWQKQSTQVFYKTQWCQIPHFHSCSQGIPAPKPHPLHTEQMAFKADSWNRFWHRRFKVAEWPRLGLGQSPFLAVSLFGSRLILKSTLLRCMIVKTKFWYLLIFYM